jgi:choline-sulfatase
VRARARRWLRLSASLALLSLQAGCSGGTSSENPDLLLVTIDTLRGDRWGCLGDPRIRTPVVDRLARGGVLAYEGRASAPITLPSHVSLMTGLPPAVHGVRDNGIFRLAPDHGRTLAEALQERGYATAAFIAAYPLYERFGLGRGFAHYDEHLGGGDDEVSTAMRERKAEVVVQRVHRWFAGKKSPPADVPLFLWIHFFDPHANYTPPAPWAEAHAGDAYRGEVAYVDRQLGRLLAELSDQRSSRRLEAVITSDHGEGLGEHGEMTHGVLLHSGTIRVPVLVRGPSYSPRLITHPVSLERVPATVLSLAGSDAQVNPGAAPELTAAETPVCAETMYPWFNFGWRALRAWEDEGWRLLSGERDRLFRIDKDPGEIHDLASEYPDLVARLRARLEEHWERRTADAFATSSSDLSPEDIAALRSLGYAAGTTTATTGSAEAFQTGPDPESRVTLVDQINHAMTLLDSGEPAAAADLFASIVRGDPTNRMAQEQLGRACLQEGRLREAREAFLAALSLGPNPTNVYLDLAEVQARLGDVPAAEESLRQILLLNENSVIARQRLSRLLLVEGDTAEALRLLREAVEIRPRSAGAHARLAALLERLGEEEEARSHWRRVLELEDDGPWASQARRAVGDETGE